ncbi:hypothetical protein D3OALGA1CA_4736 [Olavius algarvensis associated proteobacterium Delta 3]|nr:hypothetical protein D3OALGB2SA_2011 [Olavius algarvensis associated proteobacterium Delta 3]CAB5156093.1 hypothetical protein D3OALGA1CA_4736 [Olavius algarvensis associated proteobacterium Delta 3]
MVLGRNIWFNIRKLSIDWLKIKQMMDLNGQGIPRTGRGFDGTMPPDPDGMTGKSAMWMRWDDY